MSVMRAPVGVGSYDSELLDLAAGTLLHNARYRLIKRQMSTEQCIAVWTHVNWLAFDTKSVRSAFSPSLHMARLTFAQRVPL